MSSFSFRMRRLAPMLAGVLCCLVAWQLAQLPSTSAAEQSQLADRFKFTPSPVSAPDLPDDRHIRQVAPAYENIRAWISSVGASTGLFAIDGGPVSRDICLVDPRDDTVTIQPAPATGARYAPFTLKPVGLHYDFYVAPMGCLPADVNEDGWQDVVVYYWGRSPVIFLREPGEPPSAAAFTPRDLVSPTQIWNTNAATVADFDGDGHLDLFFGNYFPDGARVLDPAADQPSLVMNDSLSNAYNGGTHRIFRFVSATTGSAPDVRFEEAHGAFDGTSETGWVLAAGAYDLTGNGMPDLYIGNDFGPDQLLVNESTPGRVQFREAIGERHPLTPKSKVLGKDSYKGMGVAFSDLDSNGEPDILVGNITEPFALQESNLAFMQTGDPARLHEGVAPYDDQSEQLGLSRTGWTWDVKAADFANTGTPAVMYATGFLRGTTNRWPQLQEAAMSNDLILSNPRLWPRFVEGDDLSGHDHNAFFVRGPGGRFTNIADLIGVGTDTVSRAFAVGDVDADGRLDFTVANQWAQSTFYHNESQSGRFLGLRLQLPTQADGCAGADSGPTRPAIGAEATVRMPDGKTPQQQVYPANGHNGVNAPDLLFGLGDAPATAVPVSVSWRDSCGGRHSTDLTLEPGWHQLRLNTDGTAQEVR